MEDFRKLVTAGTLGAWATELGLATGLLGQDSIARPITTGVTHRRFRACFDVSADVTAVSIRYSPNADMSGAITTPPQAPLHLDGSTVKKYHSVVVTVEGDHLLPHTGYWWEPVTASGPKPEARRFFSTMPTPGQAASYNLLVTGCMGKYDASLPAFTGRAMAARNALLTIFSGDFGYPDVASALMSVMRDNGTRLGRGNRDFQVLASVCAIFLSQADHEYNDDFHWDKFYTTGATSAQIAANRRQMLAEEMPQHEVLLPGTTFQSFQVGRVRIVSPDLYGQCRHYQSTFGTGTEPPTGIDQETFLFDYLRAIDPEEAKLIILDLTRCYKGLLGDSFQTRYGASQGRLADVLAELNIATILVGSDPHCSFISDFVDFSANSSARLRYLCSSPYDKAVGSGLQGPGNLEDGSVQEVKDSRNQFAEVRITDNGGSDFSWVMEGFTVTAAGESYDLATRMLAPSDLVPHVVSYDAAPAKSELIVTETSGVPLRKTGLSAIDGCGVTMTFTPDGAGSDITRTGHFKPNHRRRRMAEGAYSESGEIVLSEPYRCSIHPDIVSPMPLRFISSLETESANYFNWLPGTMPNDTQLLAIDAFMKFLKSDVGSGGKLFDVYKREFLYLLCMPVTAQGCVNLVNPGGDYDLTPFGTFTTTPGVGTRPVGSSYMFGGFHGRDARGGERYKGNVVLHTPTNSAIAQGGMLGNPEWFANPRDNNGALRLRYGNNITVQPGTVASSAGLTITNRTSQTTLDGYRGGSKVGTTVTQATDDDPSIADFWVCAWNSNSLDTPSHYPARDTALAGFGALLTDPPAQGAALSTAMGTLMAALAA